MDGACAGVGVDKFSAGVSVWVGARVSGLLGLPLELVLGIGLR